MDLSAFISKLRQSKFSGDYTPQDVTNLEDQPLHYDKVVLHKVTLSSFMSPFLHPSNKHNYAWQYLAYALFNKAQLDDPRNYAAELIHDHCGTSVIFRLTPHAVSNIASILSKVPISYNCLQTALYLQYGVTFVKQVTNGAIPTYLRRSLIDISDELRNQTYSTPPFNFPPIVTATASGRYRLLAGAEFFVTYPTHKSLCLVLQPNNDLSAA